MTENLQISEELEAAYKKAAKTQGRLHAVFELFGGGRSAHNRRLDEIWEKSEPNIRFDKAGAPALANS